MKQVGFLILTIFLSLTQLDAQTNKAKVDMAFDKTVNGITAHDYGSIIYGANGKVDFNFTNQGTNPLVISDVKSSCGCTVPTWPKEPIAPGKQGTISLVYNTTLPGVFNKTVVVYSNANNSPVRLEVRGKVNTQPNDLKPGASSDPNSVKTEEGKTLANVEAEDSAAIKKSLQKAAYKARMEKAKAAENAPAKTAAPAKKQAGTVTKQSATTSATKK